MKLEDAMVQFERLPRSGEATLWAGPRVTFPCGELTGEHRAAWLRAALSTAFGAPDDEPDGDGGKLPVGWSYELRVLIGEREARLWVGGCEDVEASFGLWGQRRFQANQEDAALIEIVTEALLDRLEGTPPTDFHARLRAKHAAIRYGCRGGVPWSGTIDGGQHDCHPRSGSPAARADEPRGTFVVSLEPAGTDGAGAEAGADDDVGEQEVAAYYAANAPPGSPPLDVVREHVRAALVAARRRPPPSNEVRSRAIADALGDLANLAHFDFISLAHPYHWSYGPTFQDARRGKRKLDSLAARVRRTLAGQEPEPVPSPRARALPMNAHAELWGEVAADLEAAARLLEPAAAAAGRFRIRRERRF